jgi:Tfp pilus assembly protein PilO
MKAPIRIALTVVAMVGIAAAVMLLVVLPLRKRVEADRATIVERRTQLVKLQRVAQRIQDVQQEIKRLESALAFFEGRLPELKEVDVILREVWRIAETKALTPRSIRTGVPESTARYNTQPISMTLEGKFSSLYEFLLGLERMPRITKVRQMQIAKTPQTEGIVQVDLLMDIYFEKKP